MFSMFHHHLCAASSGVVLRPLFNTALGGKEKGARLQCRWCCCSWSHSSTSSLLGYCCSHYWCCWGSLLRVRRTLPQCWRLPEGTLLKMPHTVGSETPIIFIKIRPWSSSPENKIIHTHFISVVVSVQERAWYNFIVTHHKTENVFNLGNVALIQVKQW